MLMTELEFNKLIGTNLRKYRGGTKLRQEDLARKVGVSRSFIAQPESPNINQGISPYILYKISRVLNCVNKRFFAKFLVLQ